MATWFWLALASNVIVWSIFFYLLSRRRWNLAALLVGVLHMLFSLVLSVAPFRSFLEPEYRGLGLGFLRFEGMAATLPATLIFAWAVASAWLAVSKGRGRWMTLILAGDIFMALNFGASTLLEGSSDNWRIDFGEGKSLTGLPSAVILLLVFTLPFAVSAFWAARRSRSSGTPSPLTSDLQQTNQDTGKDENGNDSLHLSECRV